MAYAVSGIPVYTPDLETKPRDPRHWPFIGSVSAFKQAASPTTVGKGRVYSCVPGHYTWTFDDPYFRILLLPYSNLEINALQRASDIVAGAALDARGSCRRGDRRFRRAGESPLG